MADETSLETYQLHVWNRQISPMIWRRDVVRGIDRQSGDQQGMVKKQQMRWIERGAHRLLQVRTRVLNKQRRATFRRRYPGLRAASDSAAGGAA